MVNTGRPSGACGVCRERRIKCDETKPACLKCIRSGRTCSGYCHGLKLRDQTQKTIIKAKLGKPRGRRPNGSQDQGKKSLTPPETPSSTGSSPKEVTSRPRSHSLPTSDDFGALFQEPPRCHRRNSTSTIMDDYELWPLEAQMADGMAFDTLRWQTLHTPLVEKARCYFLSSQSNLHPAHPYLLHLFLLHPQSARRSSPRVKRALTARASSRFTRNHHKASSDTSARTVPCLFARGYRKRGGKSNHLTAFDQAMWSTAPRPPARAYSRSYRRSYKPATHRNHSLKTCSRQFPSRPFPCDQMRPMPPHFLDFTMAGGSRS